MREILIFLIPAVVLYLSLGGAQFVYGVGYCGAFDNNCGSLTYGGGPVMSDTKIILVFWYNTTSYTGDCKTSAQFDDKSFPDASQNANDCGYENLMAQFVTDMCSDSQFMKIIGQYPDSKGRVGSCHLYSPPSGKSNPVDRFDPFPGPQLSLIDIAKESNTTLNYYGLQADNNTLVVVFTPYALDPCFNGTCFKDANADWCAYHNWFKPKHPISGNFIEYANIPDLASFNPTRTYPCDFPPINSPNSDPIADAGIGVLSHEVMESLTDPLFYKIGSNPWVYGWWYGDNNHEIGDECNDSQGSMDFNYINEDGSNVHLGPAGHPYLIQTEWSNSNGGCTFDVAGAPVKVEETLTPDSSTGTKASMPPGGFPITFQEAGESTRSTIVYATLPQSPYDLFVTPGTLVATSPFVALSENWCFDNSCKSRIDTIRSNIDYIYYDLMTQFTSILPVGGGSPTVNLSYVTAPSSAGATDTTAQKNPMLSTTEQQVFVVNGSTASVTCNSCSPNNGERWITPSSQPTSWTISGFDTISNPLIYNHQFFVSMTVNPPGSGTTQPASDWYNTGSNIFISAYPASNQGFGTWSSSTPNIKLALPTSSFTIATVKGAGTITANFQAGVAKTYDFISDQTSCQSAGGIYDGITNTCTLSDLTVPQGIVLQCDSNIQITGTLTNYGSVLFDNRANTITGNIVNSGLVQINELTNSGTINDKVGSTFYVNHVKGLIFTNNGILTNSGFIFNSQRSVVKNIGTIDNNGTVAIDFANFTNTGTIKNRPGGAIASHNGANFTNQNVINNYGGILDAAVNNYGTINNNGTIGGDFLGITNNLGGIINNNSGGNVTNTANGIYQYMIVNDGTINNNGTITIDDAFSGHMENNNGTINNLSGGAIDNYHVIDNYGTVKNNGNINNIGGDDPFKGAINNYGGTISNISTIDNSGTINNSGGNLTNTANGTINNDGAGTDNNPNFIVYYVGDIENSGVITNAGAIINSGGSIDNENIINNILGGTIHNYLDAIIKNLGPSTISNAGTISNNGNIVNNAATINNTGGTIQNYVNATIYNYFGSTINNPSGSIITNNLGGNITNGHPIFSNSGDAINNGGTINNSGNFTNNALATVTISSGGKINNNGNITNGDALYDNQGGNITINSGGTINNNSGGNINNIASSSITNNAGGIINNNSGGSIDNIASSIINNKAGATINNSYNITNNHGTTFDTDGSFHNKGTFDNHGTLIISLGGNIDNAGNIINRCDGTVIIFGTVTGNSITFECGAIPPLLVSMIAPSSSLPGVPINLNSSPTGGVPPYTYAWTLTVPAGSSSALSSNIVQNPTFTPDRIGNYLLGLAVTDSIGSTTNAKPTTVYVITLGTCSPPISGDWTISASCILSGIGTVSTAGNVIVESGAVLTIPSGLTLHIGLLQHHLMVKSGGGVLIKAGGAIN